MTPRNKWYRRVIVVGVFCVLVIPGLAYSADRNRTHDIVPKSSAPYTSCQEYQNFSFDEFTKNKRFNLNTLCTTPYPPETPNTPAWADILVAPKNFVECTGAPFALCYYSGPEEAVVPGAAPTPCILRPSEHVADCTCYEIPAYYRYFVDINAILNLDVYLDTVDKCGIDGSKCLPFGNKEAPVCKAISQGKLIRGAYRISTFSFALEAKIPIAKGQSCDDDILYAGCMTAPCKRTGKYDTFTGYPLVQCACPTFQGPFQVGRKLTPPDQDCNLPNNTVWSAANATFDGPQFPNCVPDAPPDKSGCPILPLGFNVDVPDDVSCQKVCSEYKQSNQKGIQVGFTCDAVLCTDPSNQVLVEDACRGLDKHSTSEIIKLETKVSYSCAASQICDCEPNKKTNEEIWRLNEAQKLDPGVVTQCEYNETLCGTEPL
jgi:hypothetical protein